MTRSKHGTLAKSDFEGLGVVRRHFPAHHHPCRLVAEDCRRGRHARAITALDKHDEQSDWTIIKPLAEAAARVSPEFVFTVYHRIDAQAEKLLSGHGRDEYGAARSRARRALAEDDRGEAGRVRRPDQHLPGHQRVGQAGRRRGAGTGASRSPSTSAPPHCCPPRPSNNGKWPGRCCRTCSPRKPNRLSRNMAKANAIDPDFGKSCIRNTCNPSNRRVTRMTSASSPTARDTPSKSAASIRWRRAC